MVSAEIDPFELLTSTDRIGGILFTTDCVSIWPNGNRPNFLMISSDPDQQTT